MKKIFNIYNRYRALNNRISAMMKKTEIIKTTFSAFFMTILAISVPMIVAIELFILPYIGIFLSFMILLIMVSGIFLYFFIYYKLLASYNEELKNVNLKLPFLFESVIISSVVIILGTLFILLFFL